MLEQLYSSLSRKRDSQKTHTTIFETTDSYGTGRAWDPEQAQVTISNISDRALDTLHERLPFEYLGASIPAYPSYHQWLKQEFDLEIVPSKDSYSTRQRLGRYLNERGTSIVLPLQNLGVVTIKSEEVLEINKHAEELVLKTDKNEYAFKKVVLALGHLPTRPDSLRKDLMDHAETFDLDYCKNPYSSEARTLLQNSENVIIKGFGLTMIDLMHIAIEVSVGSFETKPNSVFLEYVGKYETVLIPYSLDGLPMVPKPIGKALDDVFETVSLGRDQVIADLKKDIQEGKIENIDQVLKPIAALIFKAYQRFEEKYSNADLTADDAENLIVEWLKYQKVSHPHIIDTQMCAHQYLKITCEMANGLRPFSLDYTIGQIWRELQIDMYYLYTYDLLPKSVVSEFSRIEDQTKRYSFGPPLRSMMEMLALVEAGVINLDFVKLPEIRIDSDGYHLSKNGNRITSLNFIDSVLDKPNYDIMIDPLMESLTQHQLVEAFDDHMGIHVDAQGSHVVDSQTIDGLYSIGRNCKGSLFGTDSIIDCFSEDVTQSMIQNIIADL